MSNMHNSSQAENKLAKALYAQDLANGTLKRPAVAATCGQAYLKAGEVTWRDYLADARKTLLRSRQQAAK